MSDYTWPAAWVPKRFQMRIVANTRPFQSPYTQGVQVVDLMADYWRVQLDMTPGNDQTLGGQIEAFFDRLKGQANRIVMWNMRRPAPLGTMRGTPTLSADVAQFANTAPLSGSGTLVEGDMLGIGGQLVRVLVPLTLPGTVEFAPRLRSSKASGTAVTWDKPTATFILAGNDGSAPVDWTPGMFTAPSIELREDF